MRVSLGAAFGQEQKLERPHAARPRNAGGIPSARRISWDHRTGCGGSLQRSSITHQGPLQLSMSPCPSDSASALSAPSRHSMSGRSPRPSVMGVPENVRHPANSFGGLLEVLKRLLELHEVRLTVQLLEDLVGHSLANAVLSIPMAEIANVFHRFSKKQRKDRQLCVGEAINEIDKYAGAVDVFADRSHCSRTSDGNKWAASEARSHGPSPLPTRFSPDHAVNIRNGPQEIPEVPLDIPVITAGAWGGDSASQQADRLRIGEPAGEVLSAGTKSEGQPERKVGNGAWMQVESASFEEFRPNFSPAPSMKSVASLNGQGRKSPSGFSLNNSSDTDEASPSSPTSFAAEKPSLFAAEKRNTLALPKARKESTDSNFSVEDMSNQDCQSIASSFKNGACSATKLNSILPDGSVTENSDDNIVTETEVEDFVRPCKSPSGGVRFVEQKSADSAHSSEFVPQMQRRTSQISRLSGTVIEARQSVKERVHRAHMAAQLLRAKTRGGDASSHDAFQEVYSSGNFKVNLSSKLNHQGMDVIDETWLSMPSNRLIIHPNGTFRMLWDICALFTVMIEAVLVPLGVFFNMNTPETVAWVITTFFAIDICLNFVTGFFQDGLLVMKQFAIVFNYMRSWFIADAVSTFPWGVVAGSAGGSVLRFAKVGKMMRVLRLLRIAKLNVLFGRVEEMVHTSSIIVVISLGKIVVFLGILCHWVACLWGWFGEPSRHDHGSNVALNRTTCEPDGPCEPSIEGSPWRRRYAVEQEPLGEQYIIALRFATGLFTGGDVGIQPGHYSERIFVVLIMFWSFILCSAVISQIVVTFHKIYQEQQEQHELMRNFKEFMNACKAPATIRAKVKRYLEFQFKVRKDLQVRRFEMMERLSPWLRAELKVHLNKSVLEQHPFFKSTPSSVLAHACVVADCIIAAPGDIVIQKGQMTRTIYFLVRGKLHIQLTATWHREESFHEDDGDDPGFLMLPPGFIGARALFMEEVHPYTVSAVAHTEMLTLTRDNLNDLCVEFPSFAGQLSHFISPEHIENAIPVVDCSLREVNAAVRIFDKKKSRLSAESCLSDS